jgi:hypothetical protein
MNVSLPKLTTFDLAALVVAAVSAGALVLELTWPHELEAPAFVPEPTTKVDTPGGDALSVGPLAEYLPVSERPLFTPDRRPFVVVAEVPPTPRAAPRAEFELTAVIIASTTQLALLRSNLTPTVQRLTLNQTIDGWTLAAVAPNAVVLSSGTDTMTIPLRQDVRGARSGQAARNETRRNRN